LIDRVNWMGCDWPRDQTSIGFALLIYVILYSPSFYNWKNGRFISMMKKMPAKKNELREAFKSFDADGDGSTTRSELRRILIKFGQHLSDQELEAVMAEVDKNRGKSIIVPLGSDFFHTYMRIGGSVPLFTSHNNIHCCHFFSYQMESYPLRNSCRQWTHTNLLRSGASLCVLVSQYILLVEKTPPIRTLQTNELIIIHYKIYCRYCVCLV